MLSLSSDSSFSKPTTQLTTSGPSNMLDTTYTNLPLMQFRLEDGSYTQAEDYYASSFYLTNLGDYDCEYREVITMTNTLNHLEDCIRVLVIREELVRAEDGTYTQLSRQEDFSRMRWTCYAKGREDGSAEQVAYDIGRDGGTIDVPTDPNPDAVDKRSPWMCTNFLEATSGVASDQQSYVLGPKSRVRYTIAVWIEGTDPDTVDERIGGQISLRFGFTTTSTEEQTID